MPEIIKFGPYLIKINLLIVFLGAVIAYYVLKLKLKQSPYDNSYQKKILNIIADSVFILLVFWKFGPFFTDPVHSFKNFFATLTITGKTMHLWIGAILAFLTIVIKTKRKNIPLLSTLDILPIGILTVTAIYSMFIFEYGVPTNMPWGISISNDDISYHPINIYNAITSIIVFLWLWKKYPYANGVIYQLLMMFGLGKILISFFQYPSIGFLGLSYAQWGYFFLIIIGFLLYIFSHKVLNVNHSVKWFKGL